MMKRLLVIVILSALLGCTQTKLRPKPNFDFTEVTFNNGWTGGQTVHIDSSGIIVKCKYHIISEIDSAICYQDTLASSQMDTMISMVAKLWKAKIDSVYDGNCEDCGGYIIRVQTRQGTIRSLIIGADEFQNEVAAFARYISGIVIKPNKVDSVYIFETTKYLVPPKPPISAENVKFVPPARPCIKCNIENAKVVSKNLSSLTYSLVAEFLCSFDVSCKNNAEYSEVANETLYNVLISAPSLLFQVVEDEQINRQHLLKEIENPINDGIDLQTAYSNVNVSYSKKNTKTQFLNAILIAASKSGKTILK